MAERLRDPSEEEAEQTAAQSSRQEATVPPEADQKMQGTGSAEPHEHVRTQGPRTSKGYLLCYALICMVGGLSSICIKQLILPLHVKQLDPVHFYTSFALVASAGAVAGLIATPLFGAISDRTTWRLGRRRTWMIIGGISAVIGWGIMALASRILMLCLGQILSQVGVDTVFAVSTALIPEMAPRLRRFASTINGMAPMVGGVLGVNLVAHVTDTRVVSQGYLLLIGLSMLFTILFLCILREEPLIQPPPPLRLGRFLVGMLEPLRTRAFVWPLASRLFAFLAYTLLGSFFLSYLRDGLHVGEGIAASRLGFFQLLSTTLLLTTALIVGWWCKGMKQRKWCGISGTVIMAIGVGILALAPGWPVMLVAAAVFGTGFGMHAGVNVTLAVTVLPTTKESGKFLGVLQDAIFLALIVSPQIGGGILTTFPRQFALVFAAGAAASLLAGAALLPVKAGHNEQVSLPPH
ncbi:MFS transporter [Reticulibacter mediterranei]|nr:MFS transporter [Reticulibacter mediterranei]